MRGLRYLLQERRWLLIALLVGLVLHLLPTPAGLTPEGKTVITITLVAVILFVTEPVPLPAVALMIIVGQILLIPTLDSTAVARSLMSDSVLFILGSLMFAVAIVKQKLDKRLAFMIVRMTGMRTRNIAIGIAAVSAILASFVGAQTVAAMMLPVALTLINLTSDDPKEVRSLAALLLLSIAYGCSIASIGTPSGGGRNVIMIGYWREFFFHPQDPASTRFLVGYLEWMLYAYPVLLALIPCLIAVLLSVFKPEQTDMSRAVVRLREQIRLDGSLGPNHWATIIIFLMTLASWILFSESIGLGTIALCGALAFLVLGLVGWDDINSGVNWGVVLLYGSVISLGIEMKNSGAATWVASSLLEILPQQFHSGAGLYAAVALLTTGVSNTMSSGAAVAVLGPITLNLASPAGNEAIVIGLITTVASAFSYLTAVGSPAATIVYTSGYLRTTDFIRAGIKMIVVSNVVLLLFAIGYWPLLGS